MKKQGIILLISLWGAFAFPFMFFTDKLLIAHATQWPYWIDRIYSYIILAIIWGWFSPALGLAKLLGIFDHLYELEIFPLPNNIHGWLWPIYCWYAIINLVVMLHKCCKKGTNKQLQGAQSPDS